MLDKEAIEKIESLVKKSVEVKKFDDINYCASTLKMLDKPVLTSLKLANLESLNDLVLILNLQSGNQFFHVESPTRVTIRNVVTNELKQREQYAYADVTELRNSFNYGQEYTQENFIVALQSCFVKDDNLLNLIDTVSKVSVGSEEQIEDDGVSQTVSGKAGITLKSRLTLPNPIVLKPFKTFPEIAPTPENFILRVTKSHRSSEVVFKLCNEKSYQWDLDTMRAIKSWLLNKTSLPVV